MSDHKKTNVINVTRPITSDLTSLYEILRSNVDPVVRKKACVHLLRLIEKGKNVDKDAISNLFRSEKDIRVATELKRALNKLKIIETYQQDPTSKYDKKLSPEEEASIVKEIEKLKRLYDRSFKEDGAFEKKYQIIEKIADGGMGRIYKASRLEDKQVVAIKFLLLEELAKQNDRERIIARFKREGNILKRLDHRHIIKGFEYGEADGEYFLVMEHVDGETLEDRLKTSPLDLRTFKTIALQLCDAVEYLHKNEIIHRDIKPGNILIAERGKKLQAKLCDFGLAKDKKDRILSKFSFTGGTDDYISPQQAKDARDADERDDIYSIGKTFYEMLTGRVPRNDEPFVDIEIGDDVVCRNINELIKKCISNERKDRWQTVDELTNVLKRLSQLNILKKLSLEC
jgi:serine/threonine protein kinase